MTTGDDVIIVDVVMVTVLLTLLLLTLAILEPVGVVMVTAGDVISEWTGRDDVTTTCDDVRGCVVVSVCLLLMLLLLLELTVVSTLNTLLLPVLSLLADNVGTSKDTPVTSDVTVDVTDDDDVDAVMLGLRDVITGLVITVDNLRLLLLLLYIDFDTVMFTSLLGNVDNSTALMTSLLD